MLDPLIPLTCFECGRRYEARASFITAHPSRPCDVCEVQRAPPRRASLFRRWWRQVKRALRSWDY